MQRIKGIILLFHRLPTVRSELQNIRHARTGLNEATRPPNISFCSDFMLSQNIMMSMPK